MIREQRKRKKRRKIGMTVFLLFVLAAAVSVYVVMNVFTVEKVVVEGNELYSDEQIKSLVLNDEYSWNSLYVDLKYHFLDVGEVPFVDTMEVSLDDPHTLRISVYTIEGVPKISGVECNEVVLYEQLPLENGKVLKKLLTLTQTLNKYGLLPEEIHYDSSLNPTLTYGTISVVLGDETYLTQKVVRISSILPQLAGLNGTLHLETWTPDTTDIIFDRAE